MTGPATKSPGPKAGGAFVAIAMLVGTGIGVALGQPSAGFVVGTAIGALIALLIWAADQRRAG
ncbi:hypothetical protein [Sphingomonas japonica]|uniref:Tetrahydromethanopterin S-methyltransferase subunit B n=1 Tax=Sphingomonas japonica TaxID=511662 RepID=A0ABX0TZL3_9SPHN|nr:hypothetical protein [Sphingomonas japonica]NIJ23759.1 tetrahydromethanopterin S-methyltransferase subunit B [Sphingomonas japonica]